MDMSTLERELIQQEEHVVQLSLMAAHHVEAAEVEQAVNAAVTLGTYLSRATAPQRLHERLGGVMAELCALQTRRSDSIAA